MNKHRNAFTLIELLVVITIIAILATVGFAAFRAASERARAAQCLSNLKNIGAAVRSYLNNSDGSMFSLTGEEAWPTTLHASYINDWRVFRSPFDKATAARPVTEKTPVIISYGINSALFDTLSEKWTSPSKLVLAAPAIKFTEGDLEWQGGTSSNQNVSISKPGGTLKAAGTHAARESINAVFADTHVETMSSTKFTSTAAQDLNRWDPNAVVP
jgi:prepilin-type N-terminal cleavage/methylation domain-containing protein